MSTTSSEKTIFSPNSCPLNPVFINTAVGMALAIFLLMNIALWIKDPSRPLLKTVFLEVLHPLFLFTLASMLLLFARRIEFSRWVFVFMLFVLIGVDTLMLLIRFQPSLLVGEIYFLPPLILLTGKSQKWRMVTAVTLFIPCVLLLIIGAFSATGILHFGH